MGIKEKKLLKRNIAVLAWPPQQYAMGARSVNMFNVRVSIKEIGTQR